MAISFNNIPAGIRVPLFYAEVDNSAAVVPQWNNRALLVGQMHATGHAQAGTATPDIPVLVTTVDAAKVYFGVGSQLARMVEAFRVNDAFTEVWCLPVVEPSAGAVADGSIAITGPASAAGTLTAYIAGQKVEAGVASGDTATDIGEALEAKINANASLPVTAVNTTGTVALTAKWKGATGNDVDVRVNYRGPLGGEALPAGVGVTITAMSGGTSAPDLGDALANLGDEPMDYIVAPFSDGTTLDALDAFMGDTAGRWSYVQQLYGHVFTARVGSVASLQTFGASRNGQHVTCLGYNASPTPPWEVAAMLGAQAAKSLSIDPARPLQTLPLVGMLAPSEASRFNMSERNTLLYSGVATAYVESGVVRLERAVTTYRENAWGQSDPSYLDVETLATLSYLLRFLRQRITQKFPRHKLANDGTRFGAGQAIVTPRIIRAELVAAYAELESRGLVENAEAFAAALVVERDATDPNRLNILYPPDLVNQLRVFAVLAQFRLNY